MKIMFYCWLEISHIKFSLEGKQEVNKLKTADHGWPSNLVADFCYYFRIVYGNDSTAAMSSASAAKSITDINKKNYFHIA